MYFAFCEERSFSGSIESCFAPKNFGKTTVFCNSSDVFCQENWFVVRCFGENPYIWHRVESRMGNGRDARRLRKVV